jgi:hypothetical protein
MSASREEATSIKPIEALHADLLIIREHLHMENYRAALVQVLESIKFLEENKLF